MSYVRKTRDEWWVEIDCGYGWEVVSYDDSAKDAKQIARDYVNNSYGQYATRVTKHRIKLEENDE